MPYPTLDQIVDELSELRPLNPVAQRIIALAEDERFSAHELAAVIASDAALTARMLKLANSAYYGFPRRISTVRDAVVLLGFRAVRATTLATCLIDAMPGGRVLDEAAFWRFSVSVGMLAELLARAEGVAPDEAFTAGVLHGIGRLALDQGLPDGLEHAVRHAQQHELTLLDAELDVLGYSDAQLGATLCERWAQRFANAGRCPRPWSRPSRATCSTWSGCRPRARSRAWWCELACSRAARASATVSRSQ